MSAYIIYARIVLTSSKDAEKQQQKRRKFPFCAITTAKPNNIETLKGKQRANLALIKSEISVKTDKCTILRVCRQI
jgi:hypothetical protein